MTREELRTLVEANLSNRSDLDDAIDDWMDTCLKEEILQAHLFSGTISEVGDAEWGDDNSGIVLPDNVFKVLEARIINGSSSYKLYVKTKRWVVARWPNPESDPVGKPVYGYVEGGVLVVTPWSDAEYDTKLTISSYPAFVAVEEEDDEDDYVISCLGLDTVVVNYATWKAMLSLEKFQSATFWQAEFERSLAKAARADKRAPGVELKMGDGMEEKRLRSDYYLDPFQKENP